MKWQNEGVVKKAVNVLEDCDQFWGFCFNQRSGNKVADKLAKEAKASSLHNCWLVLDSLKCQNSVLISSALNFLRCWIIPLLGHLVLS